MRTAHAFRYRDSTYGYPLGTIGDLVGRGWAGEFPNLQARDLDRPAGISRCGWGPGGKSGGRVVSGPYGAYPIVWDRGSVYSGRMGQTVPSALEAMRTQLAAIHVSGRALAGATVAGRLKGWGIDQRENKEAEALRGAPIPSGYEAVTGVEIEYYPRMGGTAPVTRAIFRAGLAGSVSVTEDGSLDGGGVELRVMATRENLERVVRKALAIAPGRVDRTCGLHVHLDMRHRDVDLVWANLLAMEGVICRSQPRARIAPGEGEGGGYCRMLKAGEKVLTSPHNRDRYRALNAAALGKGTIEVRAHTGSSNPAKILAWCEFLNAIADLGVEITPGATAEETLARFEGIVGREFPYVRGRMARFEAGWVGVGVSACVSGPGDSEESESETVSEDPEGDPEEEYGDSETSDDPPYRGCSCPACRQARRMGRADV